MRIAGRGNDVGSHPRTNRTAFAVDAEGASDSASSRLSGCSVN